MTGKYTGRLVLCQESIQVAWFYDRKVYRSLGSMSGKYRSLGSMTGKYRSLGSMKGKYTGRLVL